MKKTLNKLLKRNIISNFKQFLSIVVIVFLCMTLLSGFMTNSNTLERSVNKYFEETNLADAWLYVDGITDEDEEFFETNDIEYEKRLELGVTANLKNLVAQSHAKIFVYDTGKISTPYIVSGGSGCYIDQNVAKSKGIKPGQDSISFDYDYDVKVGGENYALKLKFEFLITGTMALCECADTYSSWPVLIEKQTFLDALNEQINSQLQGVMTGITPQNISILPYNQVLIKSHNTDEDLAKIKAYYENETDSNLILSLKQDMVESVVLLKSEVSQSKKMIYIFPIIFLLVSVLVIITSISQLILQEKTKIGTLKAVGANNKMLLNHYSSYGSVLCAIGALLGVIIGPLVIPEVMFVKYDLVYSLPKDYVVLSIPYLELIGMIFAFMLLGYFVSLLTCIQVVNKKPVFCIKSELKINLKSKNKKKKTKLPVSLKMAFRNIKIKPVRTIMATIGVAGCVALMLCGFGIGDTLQNSLNNDLGKVFSYDISTTFTKTDFVENVEEIEEIDYFETYESCYAEISNETKAINDMIYNISEDSKFVSFSVKTGEVVVSKSIAEKLGAKIGDSLNVRVGDKTTKMKISALVETALLDGIYYHDDYGFSETYKTYGMWMDANGDIDRVVELVNEINGTKDAQSMSEIRDFAENKISSISLMTTTLKVFALALAIVVLLNLIFLILKERIKQIATLKVIGQNLMLVNLSVCLELLFIGVIGMVLGMLLGYPLLILVLMVNKVEIINFLYYISPLSFVLSAVIILSTILIISLLSMLKIKKVSMTQALKSTE